MVRTYTYRNIDTTHSLHLSSFLLYARTFIFASHVDMIYNEDMTWDLLTTPSSYLSLCILVLTTIAVVSLHYKVGRLLFHFTSSVSWYPLLECIVNAIYTSPSSSSPYVFFLLREPRLIYSICLFVSPMLRAHAKDLWQLRHYLFVSSGLIMVIAMMSALEGTCSSLGSEVDQHQESSGAKKHFRSVYCELEELSAPYTQTYIQSNFVFALIVFLSLIHLTYASVTYCIAFKKGVFFTYFNFDMNNIESILTESAIKAEKQSDIKNNLPEDLTELSVEDAILLCEGKMSSRQKRELSERGLNNRTTLNDGKVQNDENEDKSASNRVSLKTKKDS